MLVPGLFLSVVSFVSHDYCSVDSSSPICARSLDGYLLLWWRWFGMLALALRVGAAWLMQAGFKAWSVAGLCTPQQDRLLFTGRWCWVLYWVFGPESPRDVGIRCVILCRKSWCGQGWWALALSPRVSVHTWQNHLSFQVEGSSFQLMFNTFVIRQWWAVHSPSKRKGPNSQAALHSPGVPYQLKGHLVDYFKVSRSVAVTTSGHLFKSP